MTVARIIEDFKDLNDVPHSYVGAANKRLAVRSGEDGIQFLNFGPELYDTGFPNETDTSLAFDNGTRTFTVAPTGSSFSYWIQGIEYAKTTAQTVVIDDIEGPWYIYFSGATLTASRNIWSIRDADVAAVSIIYWDATNKKIFSPGEERHGFVDPKLHAELHYTAGTTHKEGFVISGYTLGTDTDAAVTFGISNGAIYDEDILVEIVHSAAPSDRFEQVLVDPAQIPVWYRDGATAWRWDTATDYAFKNTAAGRVNYNKLNGTWAQQEATDNYFTAMWVAATTSHDQPVIAFQGQREDAKLVDALQNNTWSGLAFGTIPFQEIKVLYRIILRTKSSFGGTRKAKIIQVDDYRKTPTIASIGNPPSQSHLSLGDKDGGVYADGGHTNMTVSVIEASTDPTVNDDIDAYKELTLWLNQTTKRIFVCTDNTDGAAVWEEVGRAESVKRTVTQAGHGFAAKDAIRRDSGGSYVKAQADSAVNAEAVGIVESVSGDDFVVVVAGWITIAGWGLTDATVYFLDDDTAGLVTATEPTDVGDVTKPILIAVSATEGIVLQMRGAVVPAAAASGDSTKKTITQAAHGFAAKDVIGFFSGAWAKAQADSAANAEALGVVESVDGNDFTIVFTGYISGLSGLTANSVYFLDDDTAGLLTTTEPTDTDDVSKPMMVAISTTEGIVLCMRGMQIEDVANIVGPGSSTDNANPRFHGTDGGTLQDGKTIENDAGIKSSSQSAARAYLASGQAITTATWTKLLLATENYDTQNEFASNKFTATVAGKYAVAAGGHLSALADTKVILIAIYVNGAAVLYTGQALGSTQDAYIPGGDIIDLAASDYVELYIYHTHGSNRTAGAGTAINFMAIHKVDD
jgi:hypothetical protein